MNIDSYIRYSRKICYNTDQFLRKITWKMQCNEQIWKIWARKKLNAKYRYFYILDSPIRHFTLLCTLYVYPLWTKFFFSSFIGTKPKIGSFRLPTHRHDAHRKIFWRSLLKIELKFQWKGTHVSSCALKS